MSKTRALAIELDALGDTRALWLAWLESARGVLDVDPDGLPLDRADAALALDDAGAGNWRTLLERFCEDHAPALPAPRRRDERARCRRSCGDGATLGVFTDAPEELARIALAQLGASRRISALETGAGAFERLLDAIGGDAIVVRTRDRPPEPRVEFDAVEPARRRRPPARRPSRAPRPDRRRARALEPHDRAAGRLHPRCARAPRAPGVAERARLCGSRTGARRACAGALASTPVDRPRRSRRRRAHLRRSRRTRSGSPHGRARPGRPFAARLGDPEAPHVPLQ